MRRTIFISLITLLLLIITFIISISYKASERNLTSRPVIVMDIFNFNSLILEYKKLDRLFNHGLSDTFEISIQKKKKIKACIYLDSNISQQAVGYLPIIKRTDSFVIYSNGISYMHDAREYKNIDSLLFLIKTKNQTTKRICIVSDTSYGLEISITQLLLTKEISINTLIIFTQLSRSNNMVKPLL